MNLCRILTNLLRAFSQWIWPREIEKTECITRLLQTLYPNVDWNQVQFFEGLPWFIMDPGTKAVTLPSASTRSLVSIYFGNYDPCSEEGITLIVHEAYHAAQYMTVGVTGTGYIQPFLIRYLACWLQNGYEDSPYELVADEQENLLWECMDDLVCECVNGQPQLNATTLEDLVNKCPDLVRERVEASFFCGPLPFVVGLLLNVLMGILIPLLSTVLGVGFAVLAAITGFICGIGLLINLIRDALRNICNLAIVWEQRCTDWARQTIQRCIARREERTRECQEWGERTTRRCQEWGRRNVRRCCNWPPCSWFCRAFIWIVERFCRAYAWITEQICLAFAWVSSWVCIAWATLVRWVCVAATRVIRGFTCI